MQRSERVRNHLKAVHFDRPDWIPATVGLLPGCWLKHGEALEEVVIAHPKLFPYHKPGSFRDVHLGRRQPARNRHRSPRQPVAQGEAVGGCEQIGHCLGLLLAGSEGQGTVLRGLSPLAKARPPSSAAPSSSPTPPASAASTPTICPNSTPRI